jgi:hypothetical protein
MMSAQRTPVRMDKPPEGLLNPIADADIPEVYGLTVRATVLEQRIYYRLRPPLMVW